MKPKRINALADLALAVYNNEAKARTTPRIEATPFEFFMDDILAMRLALEKYYEGLIIDKEAPGKFKSEMADFIARLTILNAQPSNMQRVMMTAQDMAMLIKSLEVS